MMPEKSHWPFSGNVWSRGSRVEDRASADAEKKARLAELGVRRERARHDRFIVGGRAHTKQRGMS
jgi:hypothetical protein